MLRPGALAPTRRWLWMFSPVSSNTSRAADSPGSSNPSMKPPGRHQSPTYGSNLRLTSTMPPFRGTSVAVTGLGLSQCTNSQMVLVQTMRSRPPISKILTVLEHSGQQTNGSVPALGDITDCNNQIRVKRPRKKAYPY